MSSDPFGPRRQFRTPQSNVPSGAIRVAGISPSVQTAASVRGQVRSQTFSKSLAVVEKSLSVGKELLLNKTQGLVFQDLETARELAVQETDPARVDEVYNELSATAYERLDHLLPFDRIALENSAKNREMIHRANHISPRVMQIQRDNALEQELSFQATEINTAATTGDSILIKEGVVGKSERLASLVAEGVKTQSQATQELIQYTGRVYTAGVNRHLLERDYEKALNFVQDTDARSLDGLVRSELEKKILQQRSSSNWQEINRDLNERGKRSVWASPGGDAEIQEMLENGQLTEVHAIRASNKRAGLLGSTTSTKEQTIAVAMGDIYARWQLGGGNLHDYAGTYVNTPIYGEIKDELFTDFAVRRREFEIKTGAPAMDQVTLGQTWTQASGQIPPTHFNSLVAQLNVAAEESAEDIERNTRAMEGLMAYQVSSPHEFANMKINKQAGGRIDFMEKWKERRFGSGVAIQSLDDIDFDEVGNLRSVNGGGVLEVLNRRDAYDVVKQEAAATSPERQEKRIFFSAFYAQDGGEMVAEFFSNKLDVDFEVEDIPQRIIDVVGRIGAEKHIDGSELPGSVSRAVDELIYSRGYGIDTFNANTDERSLVFNGIDNPGLRQSVIIPLGLDDALDLKQEPQRAEVILQTARKVTRSLTNATSPASRAHGESLQRVMERLVTDTSFTMGFQHRMAQGTRARITLSDPNPVGSLGLIPAENSLARVVREWAEEDPNLDLEQAWVLVNEIALDDPLPFGETWEPGLYGDSATRNPVGGDSRPSIPSWRVMADVSNGTQIMITWPGGQDSGTGTFPGGWRKDFQQDPGPLEEGADPKVINPVLQSYLPQFSNAEANTNIQRFHQEQIIQDGVNERLNPFMATFDRFPIVGPLVEMGMEAIIEPQEKRKVRNAY